jgi:hypothetical protein
MGSPRSPNGDRSGRADGRIRTGDPVLTIVSKGVSSVRKVPSCLGFWRPERPCETGISACCAPGSPHDGAGLAWSLRVLFYSVQPRHCRQADGDPGMPTADSDRALDALRASSASWKRPSCGAREQLRFVVSADVAQLAERRHGRALVDMALGTWWRSCSAATMLVCR